MTKEKLYLKEIQGGLLKINTNALVNVIYNNFKYLEKQNVANHDEEYISELINSENMYSIFIYDKKKRIVGYLIGKTNMLDDERIVYFISYIYVSPNYRNNGIGTRMLNTLVNRIKHWNISDIMLITNKKNPKLINFFMNNNGFVFDNKFKTNQDYDVLVKHNYYKDL